MVSAASFYLHNGDLLHILVGGMSINVKGKGSGGGGGTFVTTGDNIPLIIAGGGGGTRGDCSGDSAGTDASLTRDGCDGASAGNSNHGAGGKDGHGGENAPTECGNGGGGLLEAGLR